MRHIEKGEPLPDFVRFVERGKPRRWEDIHDQPELYRACRDRILEEQGMLGAYTERPLSNSQSLHIDHFRKKGMPWQHDMTFDWRNLVVEDRSSDFGACYKDNNTSKVSDYDMLINPVEEYPERMMTYLANGEITARADMDERDRQRSDFTISRFNLNHGKLVRMRSSVIEVVAACTQLTDDEIRHAMSLSGFPSVVEWALDARRKLNELK